MWCNVIASTDFLDNFRGKRCVGTPVNSLLCTISTSRKPPGLDKYHYPRACVMSANVAQGVV